MSLTWTVRTRNSVYKVTSCDGTITAEKIEDNYKGGHPLVKKGYIASGKILRPIRIGGTLAIDTGSPDGHFETSTIISIE